MDEGQPEGRYANVFNVGYNAFEIVVDFGQQYVERSEVDVHTRIVTSPIYAKVLHTTLGASLADYEQDFGAIAEVHHANEANGAAAAGEVAASDEGSGRTVMAERPDKPSGGDPTPEPPDRKSVV